MPSEGLVTRIMLPGNPTSHAFERSCIESGESPLFGRPPPHDVPGTHMAPTSFVPVYCYNAVVPRLHLRYHVFSRQYSHRRALCLCPTSFLSACTAVRSSAAYCHRLSCVVACHHLPDINCSHYPWLSCVSFLPDGMAFY